MSQPTPNRDARERERLEAISALERGPATPAVSPVPPTAESDVAKMTHEDLVEAVLSLRNQRRDLSKLCDFLQQQRSAPPAVSPVPPTAPIPFSISVALDHAIAYLTGEYDEDFPMVAGLIKLRELLSAPPVAPTAETLILEQLKKYGAGDVCNTDGTFSDGDADTCNPSDYAAISALHELLLKVRGQ